MLEEPLKPLYESGISINQNYKALVRKGNLVDIQNEQERIKNLLLREKEKAKRSL